MNKIFTILLTAFLIISPKPCPAISLDQEAQIGQETDKEILKFFALYEDEALQKYVSKVGNKVVQSISNAEFKYYFKVVESSDINAFALPGGYIYVTTGILATFNSEAELAGVLGHEIGHVTSHHAVKQQRKAILGMLAMIGGIAASAFNPEMRDNAGELLVMTSSLVNQILLGYGRDAEMESDRLGLVYTTNAGYDPLHLVRFLRNLKFQEMIQGRAYHGFYATHPDTKMRIITAHDMAVSLKSKNPDLKTYKNEYLTRLEGLVYGGAKNKKDFKGGTEKKYIKIYTAKENDTIKSIAKNVMKSEKDSFKIAVINGVKEDTLFKQGDLIKILVDKKPVLKKNDAPDLKESK